MKTTITAPFAWVRQRTGRMTYEALVYGQKPPRSAVQPKPYMGAVCVCSHEHRAEATAWRCARAMLRRYRVHNGDGREPSSCSPSAASSSRRSEMRSGQSRPARRGETDEQARTM